VTVLELRNHLKVYILCLTYWSQFSFANVQLHKIGRRSVRKHEMNTFYLYSNCPFKGDYCVTGLAMVMSRPSD